MAIYVVSDIHGQYDLFLRGLSEINFSDGDYLWCLGDAIDRGLDGIKVLWHIMTEDNMDLLIGNHELMFLNSVEPTGEAICNGMDTPLWLDANGGQVTFHRYQKLCDRDRAELLNWLRQRYVIRTIEIDGRPYCLTHSFYNPECENKRYSELTYKEVWNITWSSIWRDDFYTHALDIYPDYDYTFICGHVPVQLARKSERSSEDWNILSCFHHENLINIDGGCAMGRVKKVHNGALFLRVDDMKEFAVPMRRNPS